MRTKLIPALFLVATLIAGIGFLRRPDHDPAAEPPPLPDPAAMRAAGYGYDSLDEVVAFWQRRVDRLPGDYLSRTKLGTSLLGLVRETGDLTLYARAERQLRIAVRAAPNDTAARTSLAGALSAQHEFTAALDLLEAVHDDRPDDPGVAAAIGDAQIDLGDYEDGFAAVDVLAGRLPDNPAALSREARVAALTGRNDDAIADARQALVAAAELGLRPSDAAGMWFQLATFQYQGGQVEDAESSLRSGLSIDPSHIGSRELLARVLVAEDRLDEAASLYHDVLAETPAADLHGLLAEIYRAQGHDHAADRQIQLGLALGREQVARYPFERRHLAGFYADNDPATALELAEADVRTRRDVQGVDLLAWARYLNGDLDGAVAAEREARRLGTVDATMLFHAGMIDLAAGDRDEGRDLLQQALDLNPMFDLGDVAMARQALSG